VFPVSQGSAEALIRWCRHI